MFHDIYMHGNESITIYFFTNQPRIEKKNIFLCAFIPNLFYLTVLDCPYNTKLA